MKSLDKYFVFFMMLFSSSVFSAGLIHSSKKGVESIIPYRMEFLIHLKSRVEVYGDIFLTSINGQPTLQKIWSVDSDQNNRGSFELAVHSQSVFSEVNISPNNSFTLSGTLFDKNSPNGDNVLCKFKEGAFITERSIGNKIRNVFEASHRDCDYLRLKVFSPVEFTGSLPPPVDEYDYIFPEYLEEYVAGTRVLARDGNIYQCQPYPNSGYCVQWNEYSNQYEPGIGSDWNMAWYRLN
ncbi:hypothetical protein [Vibrio aestuarianus]|uniref:hypothetical protein n=1 Tax=Vibrio aestuarianus TaxID=28171 RepID=UPI003B975A04